MGRLNTPVTARERVLRAVFNGIEVVNQVLPKEAQLNKTLDTVLMGESGELDSLRLVNLIVAIEQELEEEFHVSVNLADDEGMSLKDNPFATVGTLADYLSGLLERRLQ